MPNEQFPPKTYSQLYYPREENSGDNPRIKRRMSIAFTKAVAEIPKSTVSAAIQGRLGIAGPQINESWPDYLERQEWKDFLSCFGALHWFLLGGDSGQASWAKRNLRKLHDTLREIFGEENVLLSFGGDGVIRHKIDLGYELQRVSTLKGLAAEGYEKAKDRIERIDGFLLEDPPNGADAKNSVFRAAENIFKQMFKGTIRLDSGSARKELGKVINRVYEDGSIEQRSSHQQLQAFSNWIEGAHPYRHEDGEAAPSQPPEELYILAVSQGMAFVRWLIALRAKRDALSSKTNP